MNTERSFAVDTSPYWTWTGWSVIDELKRTQTLRKFKIMSLLPNGLHFGQ